MVEKAVASTTTRPECETRSSSLALHTTSHHDGKAVPVDGSRPNDPWSIPPEERWQAIAVTAYRLARASGFSGASVEYWLAAEAKFNAEAIRQSTL